MSIRARIEDATILYTIGRPEAALLCILTAVAATSRRRRPKTTRSVRHPSKEMFDGEAFEAFLSDEMPRICNITNYYIEFRGQQHRIEHVWYKWLRCELAHEASLPKDIKFDPNPTPGITRTAITEDGSLILTHGWLDGLVSAVVSVPENADQFGTPPTMPIPIHLPKIDLRIGMSNPK